MNAANPIAGAHKSGTSISGECGTFTKRLFNWLVVMVLLGRLQTISRAERVVLVAGGGTEKTGVATNCAVRAPFAIDFDRDGNMYIAEFAGGERVLKIDPRGQLTVFAGTGTKGDSGDGGPATEAKFNSMHHLVV
ncbi:MAG TPA: hypothetical protein VGR78_08705, partial [Verrucomicrobiae bacterium]|nr:hypothetical protein [Verrucomicrobiae bacterium]